MAHIRQEATEQPTTTRLKRAREEGQVARSSDLSSSLLSLVAIGFAFLWFPTMIESTKDILSQGLTHSSQDPSSLLMQSGSVLLQNVWLPCLVLFLAAIFSGVIQVGGLFAPSAAKFDHHRISPSTGWSRVIGSHGWMNLLFSTCKLTAAILSAGAVCWSYREDLLAVGGLALVDSLATTGTVAGKMVLASAGCMFVLGLFDVAWQRHQWKIGLMMTRQEVITERREQEGNANIRKHRTPMFISHHKNGSLTPSLILVGNTTAVSIRWNPTTMSTPVVLAFIDGSEVEQLIRMATNKRIPVQTNHWLCQQIEQNCEAGTAVPPSLHSSIASILSISRRKTA